MKRDAAFSWEDPIPEKQLSKVDPEAQNRPLKPPFIGPGTFKEAWPFPEGCRGALGSAAFWGGGEGTQKRGQGFGDGETFGAFPH